MSTASILAINAVVLLTALTALWALSIRINDASIVDIAWGSTFVLTAWVTWFLADGDQFRQNLLLGLTTIWGLRLTFYLARRNIGHGEDARYVSMRKRGGDTWWWMSLFKVFWLQGIISWVVSLPVQLGQISSDKPHTLLLVIGVAVWAVGLAFEAVGDWQLARFKANPANEGQILNTGLWAWTRHPNYFGDSMVWWGIGIVAASSALGAIGLIGPVVMTYFLINVSGKSLLERRMKKKRPGYDHYVATTSGFFPRPPRKLR